MKKKHTKNRHHNSTKKITSVDVARLAGVSQSTVSRAFGTGNELTEETKKKVLKAAMELKYRPNAIARSLTSQNTNIVGIVMANAKSPFYSKTLDEFTIKLQKLGKQTLLFSVEKGRDIDEILSHVLEYRVDGLVITSATISSEMAEECANIGTPVILFNRYATGTNVSAVCCDNVKGGRDVADYLLDRGYTQLAYIGGNPKSSTNIDRLKGFQERLQERGFSDLLIRNDEYSYESGYRIAKELILEGKKPEVIFCASDIVALGAMDAAKHEFNLKTPEEIAIVGFDDIEMASWPTYSLTTIQQPIEEMTEFAIDLLESKIKKMNTKCELKLFPGKLIKRGSA